MQQGEDKIHVQRYHEIGRAVATIMSDEIFHDVAYKAKKREHLLAGIDEFLDAVTVLPPGNFLQWPKSGKRSQDMTVARLFLVPYLTLKSAFAHRWCG